MRQSNSLSGNENDKPPLNPPDTRVNPLAMHYMDMFDLSKAQAREQLTASDLYEKEVQKKIKASFPPNNAITFPGYPNLAMTLPNQSYVPNPALNNLNANDLRSLAMMSQLDDGLKTMQRAQNINYLKDLMQIGEVMHLQQTRSLSNSLPANIFRNNIMNQQAMPYMPKVDLKQETVKIEEGQASIKPLDSNRSKLNQKNSGIETKEIKNNIEPDKIDHGEISPGTEEPALAMFTKDYPDWDLMTIFDFLKSGKSKTVFEKERLYRIEKKMRKKKVKTKTDTKFKIKHTTGITEDYKPPRSAKGVQELDFVNGNGATNAHLTMRLRRDKCKQEEV